MSFFTSFLPKKSLPSLLILITTISSLYFALPTPEAHAQWVVYDPANFVVNTISSVANVTTATASVTSATTDVAGGGVKQFLLDTVATTFARLIVQGITQQTVNWINGGFQGNPGFVTNPQQFFSNIGDYTVSATLNTTTGGLFNKLCSPFQLQVRLALINNYLYQNRIGQCSLGQIASNYTNWTNNFLNGGWNSWFAVTQNMQNNPYGSFLASQDELSIKVANQNNLKAGQIQANGGFLNFKSCTTISNPTPGQNMFGPTNSVSANGTPIGGTGDSGNPYDPSSSNYIGGDETDVSEVGDYNAPPTNGSPYDASYTPPAQSCTTQTPGSLINSQLEKVFGSGVDQLNVTQSINQIASALLTEAVKSIIGGVSNGLRGTTQNTSIRSSLASQLSTSSAESANNQNTIYNQTVIQTPANTQYAAGLTNVPPTMPPPVDPTQMSSTVFTQSQTLQQQYCNSPGATCSTGSGGTAPFNSGGSTGTSNTNTTLENFFQTFGCSNPATNASDSGCLAITALKNGTTPAQAQTNFGCNQAKVPNDDVNACTVINTVLNP